MPSHALGPHCAKQYTNTEQNTVPMPKNLQSKCRTRKQTERQMCEYKETVRQYL